MPDRVATEDDWDDEGDDCASDDDGEFPDDDDEENDTFPCPSCRELVHEQTERCPACGTYLSEEDARPDRRPGWIVLGITLAAMAVYFWVTR